MKELLSKFLKWNEVFQFQWRKERMHYIYCPPSMPQALLGYMCEEVGGAGEVEILDRVAKDRLLVRM